MSYGVDSCEILHQVNFRLPEGAMRPLTETCEAWEATTHCSLRRDLRKGIFPWCGLGSGRHIDQLFDTILPAFEGEADLLLTWQGGYEPTGIRVRNGVVNQHKVVMTLGAEL